MTQISSRLAVSLGLIAVALTPALTHAAAPGPDLSVIRPYAQGIIDLINKVAVPVLLAIAFIYFIYGVYKYFILGAEKDSERESGRQFVLWGIIGFAVILSVWGLVNIVRATFNLNSAGTPPPYPTLTP